MNGNAPFCSLVSGHVLNVLHELQVGSKKSLQYIFYDFKCCNSFLDPFSLSYRKMWKLLLKYQKHLMKRSENTVIWFFFRVPMREQGMF